MPEDVDQFVQNVDNIVKDTPLERFFGDNKVFIHDVAQNVADLAKDDTTPLGSPGLLPKTIKVSLHQQVIYCGTWF